MSKHKLDDLMKVIGQSGILDSSSDTIKHYGVKGMKWKDKSVDGLSDEADSIIEEAKRRKAAKDKAKRDAKKRKAQNDAKKPLNKAKKKISAIGKKGKQTGEKILKSIFGESKPKKKKTAFVTMSGVTTEDILQHHGVKGMRWGVRRELKKLSPGKARTDFIKNYDKKWVDKVNKNPKATKVAKVAQKEAKRMTKDLNKKYMDDGYTFKGRTGKDSNINNKKNALAKNRYQREVKDILEASLDNASNKVYGISPSRTSQVNIKRNTDGTLYAEIGPRSNERLTKQQIKLTDYDNRQAKKQANQEKRDAKKEAKLNHAGTEETPDYDGVVWVLKEDADGFIDDIIVVEEGFLKQSALYDTAKYFGLDTKSNVETLSGGD